MREITQNDTGPDYGFQLMDNVGTDDEAPFDLTGASVTMTMHVSGYGVVMSKRGGSVVEPTIDGKTTFPMEAGDAAEAGDCSASVEVTTATGKVRTFRCGTFLRILPDLDT